MVLRSRVLRGVSVLVKVTARRLPLVLLLASTRINRVVQRRSAIGGMLYRTIDLVVVVVVVLLRYGILIVSSHRVCVSSFFVPVLFFCDLSVDRVHKPSEQVAGGQAAGPRALCASGGDASPGSGYA